MTSVTAMQPNTSDLPVSFRRLRASAIMHGFAQAPWSFRFLCLYMLFEYVRPQSVYPIIAGPPYALISLAAACVATIAEGRWPRIPAPIAVTLGGFSAVLIASAFAAEYSWAVSGELKQFANWILLVLVVSATVTNERRWFLFLVAFLVFNLKMSQHGFLSWVTRGFSFASWGVTGGPGWFQNSGEFALEMGIFVSLSIAIFFGVRESLPKWLRIGWWFMPISAVGSIVASSSRGGMLALVAIAFLSILRTRYRLRSVAALAVGLPILWLTVPPEFKARFSTVGTDATSQSRLRYWKNGMEMADRHPFVGVGPGNWIPYYRDHYVVPGDERNQFNEDGQIVIFQAHNSFVEIASQLGYSGLLAFAALIVSVFWVNRRTRALANSLGTSGKLLRLTASSLDDGMVVFCIAGFFMSVAMYPFIWVQIALTAATHACVHDKVRGRKFALAGNGFAGPREHARAQRPVRFAAPLPQSGVGGR